MPVLFLTMLSFQTNESHDSIGSFEWISINLLKSAAFLLQTSENNLKPP